MSFRIYVGNYPSDFTREDVQHLFRDFNGFTLEKFIKKDKKCFSFAYCTDINQLVSVIKSKNNANVSGRKLKVRAVDHSLQDYVDLLIKDTNDDVDSGVQSTPFPRSQKTANKCVEKQNYKDDVKKFENSPTQSLCIGDKPSDCYSFSRIPSQVIKNQKCDKYANNFESSPTQSSCDISNQHYNGQSTTFVPSQVTTNNATNSAIKQNYDDVTKKFENLTTQSLCSSEDNHCVGESLSAVPLQIQVMKNQKCEKKIDSPKESSCDNGDQHYNGQSTSFVPSKVTTKECAIKQNYKDGIAKHFENCITQSFCRSEDGHSVGHSLPFVPLQVMKNQKCEKKFRKNVEISPTQSLCDVSQNSFSASLKEIRNQKPEKDINFFENSPTASLSSTNHKHDSFTTDCSSSRSNFADLRGNHVKTSYSQEYRNNELTWVSFTNFPLGTSINSIYDLFSDFDPLQVKMICNRPAIDRRLTEAHVCFSNPDIANDVILNFDNTMFNGRIVLVTDLEDLTIMNELLDFNFNS